MNTNQQAEIEELFRRINKSIQKNSKQKISEDDLNKVRAYVVQSKYPFLLILSVFLGQRPLQAVRLLQKEREERDTDENFTTQKEDIIARARDLDAQRTKYKEEKQLMIDEVSEQTSQLQLYSLKRKMEEEKLQKEKKEIGNKRDDIDKLQLQLQSTEVELKDKEDDLKRHEIFSSFLQSVVNDKSGDNEGFSEIIDLQNRFISLKDENKQLMKRKALINQNMEEARAQEKEKLNQLKNTLYD